ncbi:unnamed protein product [Microthlaspi erraticum]|uniref:Uncharacterized protein n=1 Tax=Microthlaspi erraticum TaxID=1685480 RepID=A0A6D2KV63_9BRAS|nr:unnamed protein product [Microthlaspi erraticum]
MFRARPKSSVRLKSRPKFVTGRSHHDPGNMSRGRPRHNRSHHAAHDHAARAGKQSLAAAQPSHVPRPMFRPSREDVPRPAEKPSAIPSPSDHPADREIIRPRPFRLGHDPTVRPTVPTDRPNAAVDPKPFLKPNPHNSSPKPAPT